MDFEMKQSNNKFSRLQQSFSYTWKIQKSKSSLPHHSSWLAARAGNRNYQEGGVGCCDCSIGFDKGWLQFPHLLQGGRPDPVILGNCVLAWWREKPHLNYKKISNAQGFHHQESRGGKKSENCRVQDKREERKKKSVCGIRMA